MEFSAYLDEVRAIYRRFGVPWTPAPGCSPQEISAAETRLGLPLRLGLGAAWLASNGSGRDPLFLQPTVLETYAFLSLADAFDRHENFRWIASNYEGYEDPEPRDAHIQAGWFLNGWLPFADFSKGTLMLMMDFAPSESGNVGQVIAFTHDPDEISYVAQDFPTFLRLSLQAIEKDPEEFLGTSS